MHLTRVRFRGEIDFCRLMSDCPVINDLSLDSVTTDRAGSSKLLAFGQKKISKKIYIYIMDFKNFGPLFLIFFFKIGPHFNTNYAKKKLGPGPWAHVPLTLVPKPALTTDPCYGFRFDHPCSSLFTISVPSLERLEIKDYTSVRTYPSNKSRFKINAPSLKYLEVYINGSNFEFYEDLHNLVEASLHVDYSQTDKLLRFLTSAEFLSIHLYPTKVTPSYLSQDPKHFIVNFNKMFLLTLWGL